MLKAEEIEAIGDKASQLLEPLTEYLLKDLAQRVARAGQLTSTAQYETWKLQQLGLSQKEIRQKLKKILKTSEKTMDKLLTQSAEVGYNFDLKSLPTQDKIPFAENSVIQDIVSAAVKLADEELENITQTIGMVDPYGNVQPLRQSYVKCMDYAFMRVSTGATDYMTAVREATKNLADMGIKRIDYESGVHTSIEAATRRCVMGGLGLMQEQISAQTHDMLGADGWEIDAHYCSAPDHEPIQGKQYSDEAYTALNNSLKRRIGTLNCGHSAFPIILGVDSPQYSKEELEKMRQENEKGITYNGKHYSGYEATQKQRSLETAIRRQRKRILVDEAAGDKEKLKTDRMKLTALNQEYKRFTEDAGFKLQRERMEVVNYNWKQENALETMPEGDSGQEYRPVVRGAAKVFTSRSGTEFTAKAVEGYEKVFVSDGASIKPKALHNINKNTMDALNDYGIASDRKPDIVVLSNAEMPTAFGKYDAVTNTVYYVADIANKQIMENNGGIGSVERHEMWHMKQAEDFRQAGWTITADNYGSYMRSLMEKCKKTVDAAGITEYNVGDISNYAKGKWRDGRYDEVDAEYQVYKWRRR